MSMSTLRDLKEMLCYELDEIARKDDLNAGDLETLHKLTDTVKNIDKIEMLEEEDGYSMNGSSYSRGDSYSGRRGRSRYSSARGGNSGGRSGGYSRAGESIRSELERLMDEAGSEQERKAIRRCLELME